VTSQPRQRVARRAAVVTAVTSFVLVVALAAVLVPWSWVPGGHLVPVPARALFTPAQIARSERYAGAMRLLSWSSYFLSLGVLMVLGLTPLGARLLRRLTSTYRWWLAVPAGALVVLVVEQLVSLPFAAAAHHTQLDYGISRQAWWPWTVDVGTSLLVSWVGTSIALSVLVGVGRRSARCWFAWVGGAAFVLVAVGSFLYPVVVEPLFNSFTPMSPGPFKQSVFRLADREGVHVDDVLVADASRRTTTLNA
jgi:STE24 endopeptidase